MNACTKFGKPRPKTLYDSTVKVYVREDSKMVASSFDERSAVYLQYDISVDTPLYSVSRMLLDGAKRCLSMAIYVHLKKCSIFLNITHKCNQNNKTKFEVRQDLYIHSFSHISIMIPHVVLGALRSYT